MHKTEENQTFKTTLFNKFKSFSPGRISIFLGFVVFIIVSIVFLKEKEQRPSKISSLFAEYELFKSSVCAKDNLNEDECVEEFFKIKYEPFKSSVCTKDNLDEIQCVEEFFKVTELDTELDKLFKQMETKRQEISNIISRLL